MPASVPLIPTYVVVIPAYKPDRGLVALTRDLRRGGECAIIVIDDGSGSLFSDLFKDISGIPGVSVISNAVNLGKGAALKNGFNHALLAFPEIQSLVTADADGQHLSSDILAVANASSPDSIVLGARAFKADVPLRSKLGNIVSKYVYRLLTGLYLQDTQTGLRSVPRRLAEICLSIQSNRYEFETEQIIAAKNAGFKFKEVPIQTVYVDDNSASHFNPILDSFRIYFVLLRYAFSSIATALTDFLVFYMLTANGVSLLGANMFARAVALWIQFMLLKKYVFKSNAVFSTFAAYVAYVFFSGYVSSVMQEQFAEHFMNSPLLAKVVVELVIWIFNFMFLRDIIFRKLSEV
jgi:glycosyltransferase involved in cell wall biosynthesis